MTVFRKLSLIGFCILYLAAAHGAEPPAKTPPETESLEDRMLEVVNDVLVRKQPGTKAIEKLHELLRSPVEGATEDDDLPFLRAELFQAACLRATPEELRMLAEILAKFPAGEHRIYDCFIAYTSAAFRMEVEKLKREPRKLKLPQAERPLFNAAESPKEYHAAVQAWATALVPNRAPRVGALLRSGIEPLPAKFESSVRKLLPTPPAGLWKELMHVENPDAIADLGARQICLTNRAALLSLIADGEFAPAVGVACSLLNGGTFAMDVTWSGEKSYGTVLSEFLTALGLDWELIYAGSVIPMVRGGPDELRLIFAETHGGAEAWHTLGALGSPRGVHLGITIIDEVGIAPQTALPFLLHAAGPPPKNWIAPVSQPPDVLRRQQALPAKARAEVLAAISARLDGSIGTEMLHTALVGIPGWLVKDLRTPITKLLKHPNHTIAAKALELLVGARLAKPGTRIAKPPSPIRLRLLLDGAPLVRTAVKVSSEGLEEDQDLTTDDKGRVQVSLKSVLNPADIEDITVRVGPPEEEPEPPEEVTGKPPSKPKPWPGPWVEYKSEITAKHDRELELSAVTGELELGLEWSAGIPKDAKVEVALVRMNRANPDDIPDPWIGAIGTPGSSILFPRLQIGTYEVIAGGDRLAEPEPVIVRVVKAGALKLLKLQAGRDVRFKIVAPDGSNYDASFSLELFRDGKSIKAQGIYGGDGWTGLTFGKYKLRIPSSTELAAEMEAVFKDNKVEGFTPSPPEHPHAALEVEFELTETSPATLDLGTLTLKREEAKKKE